MQIRFKVVKNNVSVDATSVVLADPDGIYGVKQDDNDAVIVAANTAMARLVTGVYQYSFTGTAGKSYTYYVKWVLDSETYYTPFAVRLPTAPDTSTAAKFDDKWRVTVPPQKQVVDRATLGEWMRTEGLSGEYSSHYDVVIDAAIEYAEDRLGCALIQRTIEALFYDGDALILPRGPLLGIDSIVDANASDITNFETIHGGTTTAIRLKVSAKYPLLVTYRAGYGAETWDVPAQIRYAITAHAATLYENRESITDRPKTVVPHSVDDFYRLRSRNVSIA